MASAGNGREAGDHGVGIMLARDEDILKAAETEPDKHQPEYEYYPTEWHEPYIGRRRELGYDLYAKLGIARALIEINPELRPALKAAGLLKRDSRSVERKKPGRKKARKSFQFSKR